MSLATFLFSTHFYGSNVAILSLNRNLSQKVVEKFAIYIQSIYLCTVKKLTARGGVMESYTANPQMI